MAEDVKRVLMMTEELAFRGASVLALRLAKGLLERNIEVVLLCTRRKITDTELTKCLPIHELPGYSLPLWNRIVSRTVVNQLQGSSPSVIHCIGPRMLQQAAWLKGHLGCPIVVSVTDQLEAAQLAAASRIEHVSAIVGVSESVKMALPKSLDHLEQRVIFPGVPFDLSENPSAILNEDRVPVVGMVGPLEVMKGGSFFLRSCHRVIEAGQPIRIVITGSGPEERNLRRLSTSLNLDDHVTFVDDGAAMSTYLSAIDIFCLPSLQQGFGIFLLEAMALGRAVIASGVGGVLRILKDGESGMVVPPSDSRSLAEKMLLLLQDPKMARKMAIAGKNLVEDNFTLDRMTSNMLTLYDDVLDHRGEQVSTIPLALTESTTA
ncbi:MAG: glycosyltransferase family 4 protein [Fuerstiella sp.]